MSSKKRDSSAKTRTSKSSSRSKKDPARPSRRGKTWGVNEIYKASDDPDWFPRLCSACKQQKKADKNEFLMSYDPGHMPLYRAYKGLLDPCSFHFLTYNQQQPEPLPTSVLDKIVSLAHTSPKTLVVDFGTSTVKVGWAGDFNPILVFPAMAGITNWTPTPVGYDFLPYTQCASTIFPVEQGGRVKTENWNYIERFLSYSIEKLNVIPEETNILLTLPTLNPYTDYEGMMKEFGTTIFEKFSFNGASFCTKESLALYASGHTTGTVVHIGHKTSRVVPIYEGQPLIDIAQNHSVHGARLTDYMAEMLTKQDPTFNGFIYNSLARDIKEKLCFVASSSEKGDSERTSRNTKYTSPHFIPATATVDADYYLESECWKCPELLFNDAGRGIHNTIYDATYYATQKHPELLNTLVGNIVLAGGSTKFPGFEKRLQSEVAKLLPEELNVPVNVYGHPARQTLAWRGGSMWASMFPPTLSVEKYSELGCNRAVWATLL